VGDVSTILAQEFSVSANVTVQIKFVADQPLLPWYNGSANLMASFKCSAFSHTTADIAAFAGPANSAPQRGQLARDSPVVFFAFVFWTLNSKNTDTIQGRSLEN